MAEVVVTISPMVRAARLGGEAAVGVVGKGGAAGGDLNRPEPQKLCRLQSAE
jgi:hypothetical protein